MFIPSKMLAIEYDGVAWHNSPEAVERDKNKEDYVKKLGINILRFKENTDMNKIDYDNNVIY